MFGYADGRVKHVLPVPERTSKPRTVQTAPVVCPDAKTDAIARPAS